MINIVKFAALLFTANEYYTFTKDDMLRLKKQELESRYDWDSLNRSNRNRAEKEIQKTMVEYKKAIDKVGKNLEFVSGLFINSDKDNERQAWDFSVNLLHRALDRFNISDKELVVDTFKDYIFESLDRIKSTDRTGLDLVRFQAAYDNFLVTNKVIKR